MVAMVVNRIGSHDVRARQADKYVDATALCQAAGKRWNDYSSLDSTGEFLAALSSKTGLDCKTLVQSKRGNTGGTWIHPLVAVNFGQWVSPDFAVAVAFWVAELLSSTQPAGGATITEQQTDLLRGQLEHQQRQLDALHDMVARLSERPPAMLSPALPRTTLRDRLRYHGWSNCPREMRRAITRHVKDLVEKFCEDVPHQAGGTAGGGPLVFQGGQILYLDEAILHYRACAERARLHDERRQPTIPFPQDRKESA